jgi:release factor glutamine methyltransferase
MHVAVHDGLERIEGPFDLLICNPPYIASGEICGLSPEVRNFDPLPALDGGPDGMAVYRAVMADLPRVLSHGWAVFEVGAGQAATVAELLRNFIPGPRQGPLRSRQDLGGHTRCVAMEIQL